MARTETDSLKKIDVRWLRKEGYFGRWTGGSITWTNNWSGNQSSVWLDMCLKGSYLSLSYSLGTSSGTRDFHYKVRLETTPCFFGGIRYWFVCPLSVKDASCNRRVGILYLGGEYFGCRHCYDLAYPSQNLNRHSSVLTLFRVLELGDRLEKIMDSMKRWRYRGQPTKRLLRLKALQERFSHYSYSALNEKGV